MPHARRHPLRNGLAIPLRSTVCRKLLRDVCISAIRNSAQYRLTEALRDICFRNSAQYHLTEALRDIRYRKLCTMLEKRRSHPSTEMNSSSLNGMDTIVGGIMAIPILISVVETMTSISRKGR